MTSCAPRGEPSRQAGTLARLPEIAFSNVYGPSSPVRIRSPFAEKRRRSWKRRSPDSALLTPSLVQNEEPSGHGAITETCTFTSSNAVGNLLLAVVLSFTGTVAAPTDSAGNTYHLARFQPDGGSTDGNLYIYYVWNCRAATGNVVTATGTGGNIDDFKVAEFAGVQNTSDPLCAQNGASFPVTTNIAPFTTVTPTAYGCLVIGWSTSDHGQTTAGAGMVLISNADTDVFEYAVLGNPSTFTVSSGPVDPTSSLIAAAAFLPQTTAVGGFIGGVVG